MSCQNACLRNSVKRGMQTRFEHLSRVGFGADMRKTIWKPGVLTSIVMLFCIRKVFLGGFSFFRVKKGEKGRLTSTCRPKCCFPCGQHGEVYFTSGLCSYVWPLLFPVRLRISGVLNVKCTVLK